MGDGGWIKLHRKIWQNPIVTKDPDHFTLWIYLLTHATHQDFDTLWQGERITLHAGQLITGRKKLSKELHICDSKVNRILQVLKSEHQIEQQTSNKGSLITILAWDKYQINEQQNEQQLNIKRTATEHQLNTIQEYKNINNKKEQEIFFNRARIKDKIKHRAEREGVK